MTRKQNINRGLNAQRGYAAIGIIAAVGITATTLLVTSLSATALRNQQDRKTTAALAIAKQALIGYAASHTNSGGQVKPGWLPCPDTDNDGSADSPCGATGTTAIGRLPWKTLGLPDVRDGSGECLWYVVSANFKNSGTSAPATINASSLGTLTVKNNAGATIVPPTSVVAIVFASGSALPGQDRTTAGNPVCGGNMSATAYLDTVSGINNATGNGLSTFIAGDRSDTFNDQLLYITTQQLFSVVNKRVLMELRGATSGTATGLMKYYVDNFSTYPWAASADGNQVVNQPSGGFPYNDTSVTNTISSSTLGWLNSNGWFSSINYSVQQTPPQVQLSIGTSSIPVCPNASSGSCP